MWQTAAIRPLTGCSRSCQRAMRASPERPCFDEVQPPAGAQDAGELAQCLIEVGDGAHRERGQGCVDTLVVKFQALTVEACPRGPGRCVCDSWWAICLARSDGSPLGRTGLSSSRAWCSGPTRIPPRRCRRGGLHRRWLATCAPGGCRGSGRSSAAPHARTPKPIASDLPRRAEPCRHGARFHTCVRQRPARRQR